MPWGQQFTEPEGTKAMTHATGSRGIYGLPDWVPMAEQHYLFHTETGFSIRAPARIANCHASTILRQVRRYEQRRDDPLIDDALRKLDAEHLDRTRIETRRDGTPMTIEFKAAELKTGHNKSQKPCPDIIDRRTLGPRHAACPQKAFGDGRCFGRRQRNGQSCGGSGWPIGPEHPNRNCRSCGRRDARPEGLDHLSDVG